MYYIAPDFAKTMEKIAIIDMGTNTFHLLIAEVKEGTFRAILKEKVAVKIGKGGINKGFITEEAWERAMDCLHHFRSVIDKEGAERVFATATSAIRNAKNGKGLAKEIFEKTQIPVRIISGDQEAELIYFGVKKALDIGSDTSLIMDIGGGSVEFIICNQEGILWKQSFEIGAQRLLDMFHYHDPIIKEEIENLHLYLNEKLKPLHEAILQYQPKILIGSSGTFDTLSDIYHLENNLPRDPEATEFPLTLEAYRPIQEEIMHKNKQERMLIPGMIELRVDMIVVACSMINFVVGKYKMEKLRVSAYALKEGVLFNIIEELQPHK